MLWRRRCLEKIGLAGHAGLLEPKEHDTGFAIAHPLNVERVHLLADGVQHLVRGIGGRREHHRPSQKFPAAA